jgi:hypothetical protein
VPTWLGDKDSCCLIRDDAVCVRWPKGNIFVSGGEDPLLSAFKAMICSVNSVTSANKSFLLRFYPADSDGKPLDVDDIVSRDATLQSKRRLIADLAKTFEG